MLQMKFPSRAALLMLQVYTHRRLIQLSKNNDVWCYSHWVSTYVCLLHWMTGSKQLTIWIYFWCFNSGKFRRMEFDEDFMILAGEQDLMECGHVQISEQTCRNSLYQSSSHCTLSDYLKKTPHIIMFNLSKIFKYSGWLECTVLPTDNKSCPVNYLPGETPQNTYRWCLSQVGSWGSHGNELHHVTVGNITQTTKMKWVHFNNII